MAEEETELSTVERQVRSWRYERLKAAGLDDEDAELLAQHWQISYQMCEALLKKGCTPTQLLRIVL